jgi:phosphatidylserine decarboxylase
MTSIEQVQYFPGKFVNAGLDKALTENEINAVVINTTDGQTLTIVQVAGLIARRILCYIKAGDTRSAVNDTASYALVRARMSVCRWRPR